MNYAALWQEIARYSLLGTDRGPLGPGLREQLDQLRITGEDDTERLLEAAALLPLLGVGDRPPAAPAPPDRAAGESLAYAPPRAATALARILERPPGALLSELLGLLRRHERIAPPRLLPALLELGQKWPDRWPGIRPTLGERGPWLAALHPAWRYLYPHPEPERAWRQDRSPDNELYLLASWRTHDPTAARAALEAEWNDLAQTPGRSEKLLATLATGLSPADLPFLRDLLANGRKSQRTVAAELLRQLPDEAYLADLEALLLGRLVTHSGPGIQVAYHKDLIADCRRLGIYPAGPAGGRHQAIRGLTAAFPPQRWARAWQVSPTQLLDLLLGETRDRDHFHHGIVDSLLRYPDPAQLASLVRYWLQTDQRRYWDRAESWELLAQAEPDLFHELVGEQLDRGLGRLDAGRFLIQWLRHNRQPYTKRMALRLFAQIREYLEFNERARYAFENQRLIKGLLRNLSLHADPAWMDELLAQWRGQPGQPAYDGLYQDFFEMLRFRGEVRRSF